MKRLIQLLAVAALVLAASSVPAPRADALPSFYIENTYYSCGATAQYKGYEVTECDGTYWADGNLNHSEGDWRYWRSENCNLGTVREQWYYRCGTTWYAIGTAPPSSWFCVC